MAVVPKPFTYHDLLKLPESKRRQEIVHGRLIVSPTPTPRHQTAVGRLFAALLEYADRCGGWACGFPQDTYFEPTEVLQPDVLYVAPDRLDIIKDRRLQGAPTIAVEVLSPATKLRDLRDKLRLYARHGVLEYWIVDLDRRTVEVLSQPSAGDYARRTTFTDIARSCVAPDLDVPLASVFAGPPKRS